MNSLFRLLSQVATDLNDVGFRWALVGGLAVGARTEPRFTRDVDLAIQVASDEQAERLIFALQERKYRIAAVLEQSTNGRLATVRMLPPGDDRLVDFLFCSSGLESMVVQSAGELELSPGVSAPVASISHLIAMKILARDDQERPQDRLDLKALLKVSDESEIQAARKALQVILESNLHRGRDLCRELEATIEEFR